MATTSDSNERVLYFFFLLFSLIMIAISFFIAPLGSILLGFKKILTSPQILTTDACALGGLAGALFNSGVLTLLTLTIMKLANNKADGTTFSAFFLVAGFSFFGKNCLNIWPILLGTWAFSRIKKEPFAKHVNGAFFACSLAPFVSEALFNRYLDYSLFWGIPLALFLGFLIGFVFPLLIKHVLVFHKEHNLFNAGLAAGFLGFILFNLYRSLVLRPLGLEASYELNSILSAGYPLFFPSLLALIFLLTLLLGFFLNGRSLRGYGRIIASSGYQRDFILEENLSLALINFAILGFMVLLLFLITKAPFTGPTVGALLCLLAVSAKGSHPRNVLPIYLGFGLCSLFASWTLANQGIVVAFCFASGLSPLAGRWGFRWGLLAGLLHSSVALYAAAIYGGFNIYSGGFVSGCMALVLLPIIEAFSKEVRAF